MSELTPSQEADLGPDLIRCALGNCIDGRTAMPARDEVIRRYGVHVPDPITIAGPDGFFHVADGKVLRSVKDRFRTSVEFNHSERIGIAGHTDCKGHRVSLEQHVEDVHFAMNVLADWNLVPRIKVFGLLISCHPRQPNGQVIDVFEFDASGQIVSVIRRPQSLPMVRAA